MRSVVQKYTGNVDESVVKNLAMPDFLLHTHLPNNPPALFI